MTDQLSETAQVWKERIQEWQASGKTLAQWVKENNFVYSQCIYWKVRFLGSENKKNSSHVPRGFLELKDEKQTGSGIIIEAAGTRIHLSTDFDQSTLLRCLALLKGGAC